MANEVKIEPAVSSLIRKAPTKTAGAIREPHNKIAAIAKPVGGQIGVTLGLIEASRRPR
jgi:hypothetical protein